MISRKQTCQKSLKFVIIGIIDIGFKYEPYLCNRCYYENDKKRLKEQAKDKYRNLPEEDKNKIREYGRNKYHNMSEEKKQRLKEYQKNYRETKKLK